MAAKVGTKTPVPGHGWRGWTPIKDLDVDLRDRLVGLLTPAIGTSTLPDRQAILDGRVPLCECGWWGDPVTWGPSASRPKKSDEFVDHLQWKQTTLLAGEFAAEVASAALDLAADA